MFTLVHDSIPILIIYTINKTLLSVKSSLLLQYSEDIHFYFKIFYVVVVVDSSKLNITNVTDLRPPLRGVKDLLLFDVT